MSELPTWRELSAPEQRALVPFTIAAAGLEARAVRELRNRFREMMTNGFFALAAGLGRAPNEGEIEMLAKASVAHLNAAVVPALGARGGATLQ